MNIMVRYFFQNVVNYKSTSDYFNFFFLVVPVKNKIMRLKLENRLSMSFGILEDTINFFKTLIAQLSTEAAVGEQD